MKKLFVLIAVVVLTACSENVSTIDIDANGASKLSMTAPSFLNVRAIDPDSLDLTVTINRERVTMTKVGDVWEGQTSVPINSDVALEVTWSELFNSNILPLAVARDTVTGVSNDYSFQVVEASYVSAGAGFDEDEDNISNLTERRQDTDPYDAASPGDGEVDEVEPMVKVAANGEALDINASYNELFWQNAQFEDVTGERLSIDNLIVSESGNAITGVPNMQWAVSHDGTYMYVYIFGKTINEFASPPVIGTRDSGFEWFRDDSVEIYWDGDLSAGSRGYDTVDDMQLLIPLFTGDQATAAENASDASDPEIRLGANVKIDFDVAQVDYTTCACRVTDRSAWLVRINMAQAQIPIGKTFGFEVQINRDDDGEDRDSKWAWFLDAREPGETNDESDLTWRYPFYMGTMKLLPFPGE